MNDTLFLLVALVSGFAAGVLFFGGLWLTVRRLPTMKHPGLVFLLSYVVRLAVVLGLVWWLSRGGLPAIGLCMAGFLVARFVLIRAVRSAVGGEPEPGASAAVTSTSSPSGDDSE